MFTELDRIAQINFAQKAGMAEGREEGLAEGEERGRAIGREEGRKEVIRNLLHQGIEVEKIAAATGFSVDEIKALK